MGKSHNVKLKITNLTADVMSYKTHWFDSGCLAEGNSWPQTITVDDNILCYESDGSWSGCSGYVTYRIGGTDLTIAFSNPASGSNKMGVGLMVREAWDGMNDHDYKSFVEDFYSSDGTLRTVYCEVTGGTTNNICAMVDTSTIHSGGKVKTTLH